MFPPSCSSELVPMDYSIAEMTCVMKVNIQCEACKIKLYDFLHNIYGVYTIDIDAEEGTVKVSGDVNPSTILRVLEDSGCYAELKSVRFHGKIRERDYYYEHNNGCLPPPYSMVYTYSAPRGPDYEWFNGTNYPFIIPPLPWQPQSTPSLAMPLPLPAPPQTLAPPPQLLPPNPPPVSMAMAPGVADVQKGSTAGCSVM